MAIGLGHDASARTQLPTALYELTMAVAAARRPEEVYEASLTALQQSLGVERASILLFDAHGVMRFRAWRGLSDEYRAAVDGHSPWSPETIDAAPVLVEDVVSDPSLESLQPTFERESIRALAFVPLALGTRLLGKFMLYYEKPHSFERWEILTAQAIAAHVAFALDRSAHEESKRHARLLAETLPALVVTTTVDGEIDDIHEGYRAYTGLTLAEARDWETHQVIHPDDYERAMEAWTEALRSGEPMQNEMRLRRHDGVYRWHLMTAKPARDADGQLRRWVTISVDIEDRKRAEARDRYLAQATASLVSSIDAIALIRDIAQFAVPGLADVCSIALFTAEGPRVETAVAFAGDEPYVAAIQLRRWRAAPGSPETVTELLLRGDPVFVSRVSGEWIEACAETEEQKQLALTLAATSLACVPLLVRGECRGTMIFVATRSERVYGEQDFAVFQEVASRLSIALENRELYDSLSRTAQELRRANEAKDEFLGLISHELKTPLTTIRGNAQILARNGGRIDEERQRVAFSDIEKESERLQRIVDNLLLLARPDQGLTPAPEPLLLRHVVGTVVARHRREHPERRFDVHTEGEPRPVLFSEDCLEQVLDNLLTNAEKYSPAGSPIVIEIERSGGEVTLRVIDEGIGIDTDEGLFEPFYRAPEATPYASGLGIGLAVCKRLVESQGGRIWACPRPGRGAAFAFTIPVLEDGDAE